MDIWRLRAVTELPATWKSFSARGRRGSDRSTARWATFYDCDSGHVDGVSSRGGCGGVDPRSGSRVDGAGDQELILNTVDQLPWLRGFVLTGGRLNAATALWNTFSPPRSRAPSGATTTATACRSRRVGLAELDGLRRLGQQRCTLDADEPFAVTDADGNYSIEPMRLRARTRCGRSSSPTGT